MCDLFLYHISPSLAKLILGLEFTLLFMNFYDNKKSAHIIIHFLLLVFYTDTDNTIIT